MMRFTIPAVLCAALALGLAASAGAQTPGQTATLPYDHIHLNVPDPAAAANWYEKHFGGKRIDEAPDRLMFGSTRFMFLRREGAPPSAGSAVDHVGFSFPDLAAKMKEFAAAGIKITTPMREVEGLFKLAFVEDPWGTRIEVVEDAELFGLHHVHLRGPDPEKVLAWYQSHFGGERTRMKGRLDGLKYSGKGFSDVWILVSKGEATPTMGRAIDHIGWRTTDLSKEQARLKQEGVEFTTEPRPLTLPNKTTIHFAYVAGPEGARVELVERPGLPPGR